MIPAILYGAKSSGDKHDSVDSQLQACRELAAREQWTVIFEDHDEGFSAQRAGTAVRLPDEDFPSHACGQRPCRGFVSRHCPEPARLHH